jgi:hypothetical protein
MAKLGGFNPFGMGLPGGGAPVMRRRATNTSGTTLITLKRG